jgi:hypothetical protein
VTFLEDVGIDRIGDPNLDIAGAAGVEQADALAVDLIPGGDVGERVCGVPFAADVFVLQVGDI